MDFGGEDYWEERRQVVAEVAFVAKVEFVVVFVVVVLIVVAEVD